MSESDRQCPMVGQTVGWALHALEPDEEMVVVHHLPDCAECRSVVEATEETFAQMGASVEQMEPPPSLRASIMAAVGETPQQPQVPEPVARKRGAGPLRMARADAARGRPLRTRGRLVGAALAVAAALVIGVLSVRTVSLTQQRDALAQRASAVTELVAQMDRPGTRHAVLLGDDGTAVAAVLVSGGQPQVATVGLAANPSDHTYVLWGVPASGSPQPLGAFDVTDSNVGLRSVGSTPAGGFAGYAISLEPGRTMPTVPTQVVAKGEVAV